MTAKKRQRLSQTEWAVMNAVWRAGAGAGLREIAEHLEDRATWSDSTIQTFLQRCVAKGYAESTLDRGRLRYTPTIGYVEGVEERAAELVDALVAGGEDGEAMRTILESLEKQIRAVRRRYEAKGNRKRSA